MKRPINCPLCGAAMHEQKKTPEIAVSYCALCHHHCTEHIKLSAASTDYHDQYSQDQFLKSLQRTRQRQAKRILDALSRIKIKPDKLIDFGAGRGWFVAEAKKRGAAPVAGTDTSELSIKTIAALGAETAATRFEGDRLTIDTRTLSFQPDIVSVLDVIEHFPPEKIEEHTRGLLKTFSNAKWLIVKVPVSNGILFRLAKTLSLFGLNGPYHQLFQVGTFPPHFQYFSKHSLNLFLTKIGVTPRHIIDDADIDDLLGRANIGGGKLGWLSPVATLLFVFAGKFFGQDSRIVIGEISR